MEFDTTAKALDASASESAPTVASESGASSPLATPPTKSIETEFTATRNADICDESKCISKGKSESGSFTCYGEESSEGSLLYPMTCADGFLPKIVEDEAPVDWTGVADNGDDALVRLRYFTCCPPDDQQIIDAVAPRRRCSDPIVLDGDGDEDAATCENNGSRRFPRPMNSRGTYIFYSSLDTLTDSFVCCDTELPAEADADATQYLEDAECVPYCDEYHKECKLRNEFGYPMERLCHAPEGGFRFPRPFGDDIYRWQCCKTGPPLPPYIQDTTFKIELSLLLILFCLGAIASALVFIGLLTPLLMQLKDGSYYTIPSRRRSSGVINARRRNSSGSIVGRRSSSLTAGVRESVGRELQEGVRYSTYNLYLSYLAVPDLAYCIFRIRRVALHFHQGQIVGPTVFWAMSLNLLVANIWMNAIVCFEVMLLLKRSQRGEFIDPPSLTRVNLQASAVFCLVITSFSLVFFFWDQIDKATADGDAEKSQFYNTLFAAWSFLVAVPPILYVIYVNTLVWCCRGYMPSKNIRASFNDKRTRTLAIYFLRIVGVFFVIWIPAIACIAVSNYSGTSWTLFVAATLAACQPIATTAAILCKPDARRHILDLVTLYYYSNKERRLRQTAVLNSLDLSGSCHSIQPSNLAQSVQTNVSSSEESLAKPSATDIEFASDRDENYVNSSGSYHSFQHSNETSPDEVLAKPSPTDIEFTSDPDDDCSVNAFSKDREEDCIVAIRDDGSTDDDNLASTATSSPELFTRNGDVDATGD